MSDDYWANLHEHYSQKSWITKPSLFAEFVKNYLPPNGKLLDLGAGLGQDSAYFADMGYDVLSTDVNVDQLSQLAADKFEVQQIDLRSKLPFADAEFDIVYAHLSLHYFDEQTTRSIFAEIHRILKTGGILAFFTNSVDDPEYGTGTLLEPNYFEIEGTAKRYFDVETALNFAYEFKPLIADNKGETYKDMDKDVHNLVRFVGKKV